MVKMCIQKVTKEVPIQLELSDFAFIKRIRQQVYANLLEVAQKINDGDCNNICVDVVVFNRKELEEREQLRETEEEKLYQMQIQCLGSILVGTLTYECGFIDNGELKD